MPKVKEKKAGYSGAAAEEGISPSLMLKRIKTLEERLNKMEKALPEQKVVILRDISKKEAEQQICRLFAKGKTLYYSDIAESLGLDLKMVVDICNKLQKRGEIKVDENV